MSGSITISLWVFLVLVAIAIFWVLERVLIPGTRWFLRRKINRVIDEINTRLDIRIKPFQLTKRQVLIDRLVYDAEVMAALEERAEQEKIPREVVQKEIVAYAREIVPSFNAYLYFRIGYWLAKKIARLLYWVRIGIIENDTFEDVDPDAAVVFVMNHRSNMDYILVTFLAAEKTPLSYAVGEWAKVWPLQTLIRSLGAYFVRRKSGNALYRRVLQRYIQMATKEGVCQAVFPEGGLSRDGKLSAPKLGVYDYMLRNFNPREDRDIVFIPVGINYDRAVEDRSLLHGLDPHAPERSTWFVIGTTAGFIWRSIVLMILSRWQKFGFASVNFGKHLSARQYCNHKGINFAALKRKQRFEAVGELAARLANDIEELIPVLPVPLVAAVMLNSRQRWISAMELESAANDYLERLANLNAPIYIPQENRVESILMALQTLNLRRFVEETDGRYRAAPENIEVLDTTPTHWRIGSLMMKNDPPFLNVRVRMIAAAGLLVIFFCLTLPSQAEFYKYTDKGGNVYFVDDISQVPVEYRSQIETYREKYDHLSEEDKVRLMESERRQALENQEQIELHIESSQAQLAEEEKRRREREQLQSRRRMETKVEIQDNRILVPVVFSNFGIEIAATLLLDTGASHTVLHRQAAEQLRIITIAKGYAKTAGGQNILSELGTVDLLTVGPVAMKDAQVIVFTHEGPAAGYDGLLGMNFLSRVQYTIDYERQIISWRVR